MDKFRSQTLLFWGQIPICPILYIDIWLVVSTPLKNISQWEGLSHILWEIKYV